ncbi:hypothetical protein Bca4012_062316 [Brassica carinata]
MTNLQQPNLVSRQTVNQTGSASISRNLSLSNFVFFSIQVDEAVALESQTIVNLVEDDCVDNGVPLPNVTSKILAKVIEYCKKHVEAAASKS